ncbi:IS630 family transposase [Deinococcus wulumuqiensis]|nr:IS630 family transposase [Deinococcus wulumuqiensis]QII22367.1 IS630 family transposase [Deinococcus wulumuqiensis R12]
MTLKYLDQTGLSLMLSIGSTWFKRGSGKQFEIPTRWGSSGRINLIGTYSLHGTEEQLEVRELSGSCNGEQVMAYLDTLALQAAPDQMTVVVLDNAPFHKGAKLREKAAEWEKQGLYLRYLPPYAPMLNLIEEIWRKLKGIVMPRRCYNSVDELREAVLTGLKVLGARFI